jgi:hypothetical protein
VLVDLAREHVDLNFGVFLSEMVGCTTAASTKPLLQLWIPSDFVSHDDEVRFRSAHTENHIVRLALSKHRTELADADTTLVKSSGLIFRHSVIPVNLASGKAMSFCSRKIRRLIFWPAPLKEFPEGDVDIKISDFPKLGLSGAIQRTL